MEPFAPPVDPLPPAEVGTLELGTAVVDALRGVARNVPQLLLFAFATMFVYTLSIITCVGWIVGLPVIVRAMYRAALDMVDDRVRVDVLWTPGPLGPLMGRMWGLALVQGALTLPVMIAVVVGMVLREQLGAIGTNALVGVVSFVYGFLLIRWAFAPFRLIENPDLGVADAFRESWSATGPVWATLAGIQLLVGLLGAPVQVLSTGVEMMGEQAGADPSRAIEMLPQILGLYAVLLVMSGIYGAIGMALYASSYRQLFGRPAA